MTLVEQTLVTTYIEPGWPLTSEDVQIGKRYLVDMDRTAVMTIVNQSLGKQRVLICVWIVEPKPEGWLPLMAFQGD
jgi:hypothetical protein